MAAVKLVPATLWLGACKVVREECVITRVGVKSVTSRPRKAGKVIRTSHQLNALTKQGEQEADRAHSAHVWIYLCMSFLSVCLCGKWGDSVKGCARDRGSEGGGGHRVCWLSEPRWGERARAQHAVSFQQPSAGHFFRLEQSPFKAIKQQKSIFLSTPSLTFADLQG